MKKLLTILALVLTVALCASFAVSADKISGLSSASKDITLNYDSLSPDESIIVYSADVTWTDVEFIYDAGTTQWNPEKHDYSTSSSAAKWTDNKGEVKVANHSNADIDVTVAFAQASTANGTANITVENGSFTLTSGVGVSYTDADSDIATLTASGKPTSNATIGTVTVTIAAAN